MSESKIRTVGVVGCGLMGSGIAQTSAVSGFPTTVVEAETVFLEKGLAAIRASLEKLDSKGKLPAGGSAAALAKLKGSTRLEDLAACDLVIEAITEDLEAKRDLLTRLDQVCGESCLFASNTSSLSITSLMMSTRRPQRFLGLHFFNPVPLMPLVEVVGTLATDAETLRAADEFVSALGKQGVRCGDKAGFVVNRLLVPYLLDAIRAFEEGVGTLEDIDLAMRLGCGYPMGPFTLLDLVGLDTIHHVAEILYREFREKRFAPPPLLCRMVESGRLGRKSGRGFFEY